MSPQVLAEFASLGVAGLLFVMWWLERQERVRTLTLYTDADRYAGQFADSNRSLLDVVRANTEALAALREELRSHRSSESEWLGRLMLHLDQAG